MILTILGTVVIYSLLSQVMTRLMDVRETDPNGVLIVGSNIFSRQLALLLEKFNVPVTLWIPIVSMFLKLVWKILK